MKRSDALLSPYVVTVLVVGLIALAVTLTRGCTGTAFAAPDPAVATIKADRDRYQEYFSRARKRLIYLEYQARTGKSPSYAAPGKEW